MRKIEPERVSVYVCARVCVRVRAYVTYVCARVCVRVRAYVTYVCARVRARACIRYSSVTLHPKSPALCEKR